MRLGDRRDRLSRRQVLAIGVCSSAGLLGPAGARAGTPPAPFTTALAALAGGREIKAGRVHIDMPRLAENGNSVAFNVTVDSPMTAADHVRTIHLLSERNPIPLIARFHIGPRAGRAVVRTYVRLATTQNIHAVAEMSDGSLWSAEAESVVLLAACIDGG
ncbi:MAG: thiosulfate oxidation carrier protein SoxY [Hyphomicrobiaceae bacterium]